MIPRRRLLAVAAASPARAEGIAVTRRAAEGMAPRPSVLLLHGSRGMELNPEAYERHAAALAAAGMDAWLLRYFSAEDTAALDARAHSAEARDAYRTRRFAGWAEEVLAVVTDVLERLDCSGAVGLLGFSLGGFVAAATAARDPRVKALVVMYGGMPEAMRATAGPLPPLLVLHGEADRVVSLAEGAALVELARRAGGPAELVAYPGRGHGFDFAAADPATADAVAREVRFFVEHLVSGSRAKSPGG